MAVNEIDPKLSRIYREASSESPPAAVDAAILEAARRQAEQPRRHARSSWVRWMAPASALATLLVAVSLAFLVERETPQTPDGTAIRTIPLRPQSAPPAGTAESTKAKAADRAVPAADLKQAAPALSTPAPAAMQPARASVAPAAPAAQAFPAESRAKAAESESMRQSNIARDAALGAAGTSAAAAPAAAGTIAPLRQEAVQRSPEAWLDEIARLKREGRDKEAAERLVEFRKIYPAYAVPENLLK